MRSWNWCGRLSLVIKFHKINIDSKLFNIDEDFISICKVQIDPVHSTIAGVDGLVSQATHDQAA